MFAHNTENFEEFARRRAAFTLVELLMVIMLIGILSTFVLVTMAGVNDTAREDRTKAQIMRIHESIMEKWQSFAYRRVPPVNVSVASKKIQKNTAGQQNTTPLSYEVLSRDRLNAVRDLMRLELPNSRVEVIGPSGDGPQRRLRNPLKPSQYQWPALSVAYYQRARANVALVLGKQSTEVSPSDLLQTWTTDFESAECLYLILSQMQDPDGSALEFFSENEIGDADGDGMKEIHDGWGNPILFLRWAPGFVSPLQKSLLEDPNQDDVFDLGRVGNSYSAAFVSSKPSRARALYPLIFSAGPDQKYGIKVGGDWYAALSDPHHEAMKQIGAPQNPEDVEQSVDNITNHLLATR